MIIVVVDNRNIIHLDKYLKIEGKRIKFQPTIIVCNNKYIYRINNNLHSQ